VTKKGRNLVIDYGKKLQKRWDVYEGTVGQRSKVSARPQKLKNVRERKGGGQRDRVSLFSPGGCGLSNWFSRLIKETPESREGQTCAREEG